MLQKPKTCAGCPLDGFKLGGFSYPEGTCNNGVLIVGEALGEKEKQDGLPLRPHAESGSVLQAAFKRLQLERDEFALWNLIACQPPFNNLANTPYEFRAIEHCRIHFAQVLNKFKGKVKVIFALGNLPLRHLCTEVMDLYQYALDTKDKSLKKKLGIYSLRGYKFQSFLGVPIVGTLHPSNINRDGRIHLHTLMRDLWFALEVAKGNVGEFKPNYLIEPTFDQAREFIEQCRRVPNEAISYDIETPDTVLETDETELEYENLEVRNIDSIQFSIKENTGIFLPWFGEYVNIAAQILALPNPKIGWNNWEFDKVNLEYHLGKGCINGVNHDLMWAWKHANADFVKTGRALQFAANWYAPEMPAWKHTSKTDSKNYACQDVDAVKRIDNGLVLRDLKDENRKFRDIKTLQIDKNSKTLFEGYTDDIVNLRPILEHLFDKGLPIDIKAREEMRVMLVEEIIKANDLLQELYPFDLRNVTPKEGYKYVPKEIEELTGRFNELSSISSNGDFVIFGDAETHNFYLSQFIEKNSRLSTDNNNRKDTTGLMLREFDIGGILEKRWCRVEKFKPGSSHQVLEYIKYRKYKVPMTKDYRKGDKETTTKDKISLLFDETGDRLFENVVYIRELRKMKSTYVDSKRKGWVLSSDNRVHAKYTPLPATGQLGSKLHNAPARGTRFSSPGYKELANQFRKTICAGEGKLLLSGDWSAFHALTLAFEAEDSVYMRLVRLDPHSFLAAHILYDELPHRLKTYKVKKPANLTTEQWLNETELLEKGLAHISDLYGWLKLDDEKLKEKLKWIKKNFEFTRNSQAKPALLGMGFGMKEKKFYKMNRFSFQSEKQCENVIKKMRLIAPKTFTDYPDRILELADRQGFLISRYGYIRRFNFVYDHRLIYNQPRMIRQHESYYKDRHNRYWKKTLGQDGNAAIAFYPSNDAFGKKKEAMRELWEYEQDGIITNKIKSYGLINEIHDDLMFEVEKNKLEEAAGIIKKVMERPAKHLKNSVAPNGLVTYAEMKFGKNWAPFDEKTNPEGMREIKL